ncbi:hypothetical protein Tco_1417207 [Tanacetum coccineum]
MIGSKIFCSFIVSISNQILGKNRNPPHGGLALAFFLGKEYTSMARRLWTAPIAKSLASHISSKGKSQSGAIKIGASVNFLLSVLKDSIHSSEKKNGVSFSSKPSLFLSGALFQIAWWERHLVISQYASFEFPGGSISGLYTSRLLDAVCKKVLIYSRKD